MNTTSKKPYDILIVGAGLYGVVCARELTDAGKRCLVLEKRNHIGGNVYTEDVEGIAVHQYGAHIFHTNLPEVWTYVNRFARFNRYTHQPVANYLGEIYPLPFTMSTFNRLWGVVTPREAAQRIAKQRGEIIQPKNLEEQAISLVGTDLYEKLIRGYTEKQWGRPCSELPPSIIRRLPVRFTYDNNYFDALYQGIPIGGYTAMVEKMLEGIDIQLNTDFLRNRADWESKARHVLFTGSLDAYFDYALGPLEYRSVLLEHEVLDTPNHQGVSVMNYTDGKTPYTRIIEHKHFTFGTQPKTIISREYSVEWTPGGEPYYPVNNERNNALHRQYATLAAARPNFSFGGRLGDYIYRDMDTIVDAALAKARQLLL